MISVEAMSYGDAYIRVVLDMSNADIDPNSATTSCTPTMDAWVVTMWSMSDHLEAAAFSTALAAQTLDATVDVMITSATACNTSTSFPNLAVPGSPLATSGGPVPSGLGVRFSSIKITQE